MKHYFKTLFTLLILLSLTAASSADVVAGKVLDSGNRPVANADVLMRFKTVDHKSIDSNKWQYLEATCDNQGKFSADFSGKIDFASEASRPIVYAVAPGKTYSVALLQPENNILYLDDAETVSGRVLDRDGSPVANVKVRLRQISGKNRPLFIYLPEEKPWRARFQTTTDEDGFWKLQVVPKGEAARLEVSDPRFVPADFFVKQGEKPATTRVDPGAVIRGRVVNEKGVALANVKLQTDRRQHAITDAKGVFEFTGLIPRKYHIDADADHLPLVTPQFTVPIAIKGETKVLPDIVMTPGALVIGTITNKETGEPVADARVSSSGINDESGVLIRLVNAQTNAEGRYQLRLPSGENEIFASTRSKKYFRQFIPRSVTLREGETITQNFTITSGETLRGVVLDKNGKPLQDIPIIVDAIKEKEDIGTFLPRETVTDAAGKFIVSGIAPRKVQVRVGEPWATDKLITFTLPHPTEVLLRVIPQNELPPIGRLIDTNGKPLANTKVTLQYQMPHPTPFNIKTNTVLTSDKNGYLRFRMPLVAKLPEISDVEIEGYQWTSGGEWNSDTQKFSDLILNPLTRKVSGRVVDAQGNSAGKARMLIVGLGKGETRSKPDGSFAFSGLPVHQQLTLLAIGKAGVAKMLLGDSQKTAVLQLKPLQQKFPLQSQSLAALENLYRSSTEVTERNSIIEVIARYDAPRILKMIQRKQKTFPAAEILQTLDVLAENDPHLALRWGKAHLAQVSERDRVAVLCQLAKLAAEQNPALAQKYFSQAVSLTKEIPEPKEKTYKDKKSTDPETLIFLQSRIELAGAAAKVQPAQTRKWVDEILQFPKEKTDKSANWPHLELVAELAVSDPQEAARVIASSDENAQIFEYQNAVQAAVKAENLKWSLYWLEQFRIFVASQSEPSTAYIILQEAAISVINLIGTNDPEQALEMARSMDDAHAIVAAALFQPRDSALELLREQYDSGLILGDARLAGLIYDADNSQGKVLFDELAKRYWTQLNTDIPARISASDIAYDLARYKPHESWLMLQTEWAQALLSPLRRASSQASLALAMSSVDFEEALKWARQIGVEDERLSIKTQRQLWEIALATPQQRREISIACFYISDSYKPGDPVIW